MFVAGGAAVVVAMLCLAAILIRIRRDAVTARFAPAIEAYVSAVLAGAVGMTIGILLGAGRAGSNALELREVHLTLNVFGLIGLVVAGTLPFFAATQVRSKMSPRATPAMMRTTSAVLAAATAVTAVGHLAAEPIIVASGLVLYALGLVAVGAMLPIYARKRVSWAGPRVVQLVAGIAWWMAMIRIRSLHRISFDQARMYDRRVYDQRVKLARNLHDSLGGDLIQLSLQLKGSASREEMLDLAQEIMAKTRNLVYTLEPGNANENFAGFIRSYVERLKHTGKFNLTLDLDPAWPAIRVDQSLNLQAIFTEWMTNMIRHSQATEITITLRRREKDFALAVSDNGRGFRWNGSRAGSGLRNIALRAGLMNARVFVRRRHADHGAIFYLQGRLLDD